VITEVSLKVLPKPRQALSISLEMDSDRALSNLAQWGQQPLPISAACHDGQRLHLRLEGGEGSVAAAHDRLGGEWLDSSYWEDLNEQRLSFFDEGQPLWRLSVPHNTPRLSLPGQQLIDWGGAQRWLKSEAEAAFIRKVVDEVGGHVTCYSHGLIDSPFQPLPGALMRYHQNLKQQLDPRRVFNPGRLYAEL
jgi:glycolate oxidase FAD binding subunit